MHSKTVQAWKYICPKREVVELEGSPCKKTLYSEHFETTDHASSKILMLAIIFLQDSVVGSRRHRVCLVIFGLRPSMILKAISARTPVPHGGKKDVASLSHIALIFCGVLNMCGCATTGVQMPLLNMPLDVWSQYNTQDTYQWVNIFFLLLPLPSPSALQVKSAKIDLLESNLLFKGKMRLFF